MEFFGLLGEKLGHSLSPTIHKLILENINKDGAYKLFQIPRDNLKGFIDGVKLLEVKGFNVTIPYKEDIIKYLDYTSNEAKRIGAVNTVVLKENKLYGYNTDYYGFGETLKRKNITVKNKIAVILGAGGACKAALTYLLDNDIGNVYIVSRNPETVNLENENRSVAIVNYDEMKNIKGDIIINSTPVGMYPNIGYTPVEKEIIKNFEVAVDLIYNPLETEFLKLAKEEGKIALGGLYMLVGQAAKAQEIFQDMHIDNEVINSIYSTISRKFY